jgi:putative MFS transporter
MDGLGAVPDSLQQNRGFLRRITLATAWGEGLNGYDPGIISVVLTLISRDLRIPPGWLRADRRLIADRDLPRRPALRLPDRPVRPPTHFTFDIVLLLIAGLLQAVVRGGSVPGSGG